MTSSAQFRSMSDPSRMSLPDSSGWRFDEIASHEPCRLSALEAAGAADALVNALVCALGESVERGDARFGWEHGRDRWEDCRTVVQFGVGAAIFDWFFNARSGYRAHFRGHYARGLAFNTEIIEALCRCLDARLPEAVTGLELDGEFEDCGATQIPKDLLIESLVPELSKVWFCARRIYPGGGVESLATGVLGPRILLHGGASWAAPYREDDSAWLDVKGAFLGEAGPYQPKDQVKRAMKLRDMGEA